MRAQVGLSFDQFFARSQSAKGMFGIRICSLRPCLGSSFFFQRPMEAQSSTAFTNCSQRGFKLYDSSDESPSANFQINSSVTFESHSHLQLGRSKNWFEPQRQGNAAAVTYQRIGIFALQMAGRLVFQCYSPVKANESGVNFAERNQNIHDVLLIGCRCTTIWSAAWAVH